MMDIMGRSAHVRPGRNSETLIKANATKRRFFSLSFSSDGGGGEEEGSVGIDDSATSWSSITYCSYIV